jgi:hypothetical protein
MVFGFRRHRQPFLCRSRHPGFGRFLESFVFPGILRRIVDAFPLEELSNGKDLQLWVIPVWRFVETGPGCLGAHGFRGLLHAEQNADLGLFAVHDAAKIAKMRDSNMTCCAIAVSEILSKASNLM